VGVAISKCAQAAPSHIALRAASVNAAAATTELAARACAAGADDEMGAVLWSQSHPKEPEACTSQDL
jgi:hypothetical protein